MSVTRIEVLSCETKEGTSYKSGQPKAYSIRSAHCVLHLPEGKQIGLLRLPKEMPDNPAPGLYDMEFGIKVDFQTHEVGGRVISLKPVSVGAPAKAVKEGL